MNKKHTFFTRGMSLMLSVALVITTYATNVMTLMATAEDGAPKNKTSTYASGNNAVDKAFNWDGATVYFALTDRFLDGDATNNNSYGRNLNKDNTPIRDPSYIKSQPATFHGGDIAGLTKKVNEDYFNNLGVNAIWITAPYEQIHGYLSSQDDNGKGFPHYAYHGYYTLDYTEMDKNVGTAQEFGAFVLAAHSHGIRVIMDVVMNHPGYPNMKDAADYGINGYDNSWKADYYKNWDSIRGTDSGSHLNRDGWAGWWGRDWVRVSNSDAFTGYDKENSQSGDTQIAVGGLPDFKTESDTVVGLPPILETKWTKEAGTKLADEKTELDNFFTTSKLPRTVDNYIIKWLTDWVREYGIDGFRCDTAKHVNLDSWKELSKQADIALADWRKNNTTDPARNWTDSFYMTGEVYGNGLNGNASYYANGFDSLINFDISNSKTLPKNEILNTVYGNYEKALPPLTYISSHDTQMYDRADLINAGTKFLMYPGAVQIYYGDETARPLLGNTYKFDKSYQDQKLRTDMNWTEAADATKDAGKTLAHWQKLGAFRGNHVSVGIGAHAQIKAYNTTDGYTFSRIDGDSGDAVVVNMLAPANTDVTIDVSTVFPNGIPLRNAYNDARATVADGKVTFNSGANSVILVEPVHPVAVLTSSKESGIFDGELEITVNFKNCKDVMYNIDYAVSDTALPADGKIKLGSNAIADEPVYLTLKATDLNSLPVTKEYVYTKKGIVIPPRVTIKNIPADWTEVYCYTFNGADNAKYPGVEITTNKIADGTYFYADEAFLSKAGNVIFSNGGDGKPQTKDLIYKTGGQVIYDWTKTKSDVAVADADLDGEFAPTGTPNISLASTTIAKETDVTISANGATRVDYKVEVSSSGSPSAGTLTSAEIAAGKTLTLSGTDGDVITLTVDAEKDGVHQYAYAAYLYAVPKAKSVVSVDVPDYWAADAVPHINVFDSNETGAITNWDTPIEMTFAPTAGHPKRYTYVFENAIDNSKNGGKGAKYVIRDKTAAWTTQTSDLFIKSGEAKFVQDPAKGAVVRDDTTSPAPAGTTVKFIKPADWGEAIPHVCYFDVASPAEIGIPMTLVKGNEYTFTFPSDIAYAPNCSSIKYLIKNTADTWEKQTKDLFMKIDEHKIVTHFYQQENASPVIDDPDMKTTTIKFTMPQTADWTVPHMIYWDISSASDASIVNDKDFLMTKIGDTNVYYYTFPADAKGGNNPHYKIRNKDNWDNVKNTNDITLEFGSHREILTFTDNIKDTTPDPLFPIPLAMPTHNAFTVTKSGTDYKISLGNTADTAVYTFGAIKADGTKIALTADAGSAGTATWTAPAPGKYLVYATLKSGDDQYAFAVNEFYIPVSKKTPPVITLVGGTNLDVQQGATLAFDVSASTFNEETTTLDISNITSLTGATYVKGTDTATGKFSWTVSDSFAAGNYKVTFTAVANTITKTKDVNIRVIKPLRKVNMHFRSPSGKYDQLGTAGDMQWTTWTWYAGNKYTTEYKQSPWGITFTYEIPEELTEFGHIFCKGKKADAEPSWGYKSYSENLYPDLAKFGNSRVLDVYNMEGSGELYYDLQTAQAELVKISNGFFTDSKTIKFNSNDDRTTADDVALYKVDANGTKTQLSATFTAATNGITGHAFTLATAITPADIMTYSYVMTHTINGVVEDKPIDISFFFTDPTFVNATHYTGTDLGSVWTEKSTTFKVWAPTASKVMLNRYTGGVINVNDAIGAPVLMTKDAKGVWSYTVTGDIKDTFYTYTVTTAAGENEVGDVNAKAAGVNGDRSMVVNLSATNPQGWDKDLEVRNAIKGKPQDAIIWEVHVRDFSAHDSSGVKDAHKGKYLAFTDGNTTVNGLGNAPTCVNYLKQLGVTHVHLLPVYDYASVNETGKLEPPPGVTPPTAAGYVPFNWGYDPKNYNVPEGSYSSDPYNGNTRIIEFKQMVMALHNAGIKVVMDVVYNHTYATADSFLQETVPNYYYRMKDGKFLNGSGCGNETASDHIMYGDYMVNSVNYWATEYHIDGFRFDLMKVHDAGTMQRIRNTLDQNFGKDTILMYGEGWTAGGDTTANAAGKENAHNSQLSGIAMFGDGFRDSIKGSLRFDGKTGYVQTGDIGAKLIGGIEGAVGQTYILNKDTKKYEPNAWDGRWSESSDRTISYTSAHDNLPLWDKLVGDGTGGINSNMWDTKAQQYIDMNKMAGALVLTSHGIPFMQAGEEFARTKLGDENSYNSPDKFNIINWERASGYSEISNYYAGLIDIRKAFPGFTNILTREPGEIKNENDPKEIGVLNSNVKFVNKKQGMFSYVVSNPDTTKGWQKVAVIMNPTEVNLTSGDLGSSGWTIIANHDTAGLTKLSTVAGNTITLSPRTVVIAVDSKSYGSHSITVGDIKGGYITADKTSAQPGETVTVTVSASQNHVYDADSLTQNGIKIVDGKFIMPDSDVVLSATFQFIPPPVVIVTTTAEVTTTPVEVTTAPVEVTTAPKETTAPTSTTAPVTTKAPKETTAPVTTIDDDIMEPEETTGKNEQKPVETSQGIDEDKILEELDFDIEGEGVDVDLAVPSVDSEGNPANNKLSEKLLEKLKNSKAGVKITITDGNGVPVYEWNFGKGAINNSQGGFNLDVEVSSNGVNASSSIVNGAMSEDEKRSSISVTFGQQNLPGKATLSVNVSSKFGEGKTVYLYRANSGTGKLELVSMDAKVVNGMVNLDIENGDEYIISDKMLMNAENNNGNPGTGVSISLGMLGVVVLAGALALTSRKKKN